MEFKGKKIVIADNYVIGEYDDIAREFLKIVFDQELDECLITDESTLSDFSVCCLPEDYESSPGLTRQARFDHLYKTGNAETVRVIKEKYDIDVETSEYLITVFEKILQNRNKTLN